MSRWWRDERELREAVERHGSPTQAARALGGVSPRSAREAWRKMREEGALPAQRVESSASGPAAPGARIGETEADIVTPAVPVEDGGAPNPEELLAESGLDISEWDYDAEVRCYDQSVGEGRVRRMHYLRVRARRKPESALAFEVPAGWKPPAPRRRKQQGDVWRTLVLADPHCPNHEHALVEAQLAWIEEYQPRRIVCLGDAADNSPFKRHRLNRRTDCTVKDAVWSTYEYLSSLRQAAPDSEIRLLYGNHDMWLECRINEMFPKMMELVLPGEDRPHLAMSKILKLDELRIDYEETGGEYHDVSVQLADDLVAMHGTKTGQHGGAAKEQAGWEGASIIQGHDHKLALIAVTKRLPGGGETQRYAVSCGTSARRDLGYDPKHNVNQGHVVLTHWPDGRWHPDFALYDPVTQETTWRDWRYSASPAGAG